MTGPKTTFDDAAPTGSFCPLPDLDGEPLRTTPWW